MEEDNIKRVCKEKVDKEEDNAEDIHGEFVVVDDDDNKLWNDLDSILFNLLVMEATFVFFICAVGWWWL